MTKTPAPCPDATVVGLAEPTQERFQFTLRHLLTVMLTVAVTCGLAVSRGVESCPMFVGLVSAIWNARGNYELVQRPPQRNRLTKLAWLILAVSMCLPAAQGCGSGYIMGWQAATQVATLQYELTVAAVQPAEEDEADDVIIGLAYYTMLNVANLSSILAPLVLWFPDGRFRRILITALAVSSVFVFATPWDGSFLIGYYVWAGSFVLMLAAWRIGWKTFAVMVLMCALMLAQHFAN